MLLPDAELLARLNREISIEHEYSYDYNAAFADIYPLLRQAAARIEQLQRELADAKAWAMENRRQRWAAEERIARLEESKLRISKILSRQQQGANHHG